MAGRGDRTAGAVIGGIAGALLGRTIDRNDGGRYSCR
ncbi:glycine zipper 2TM domain-containing protein [Blastomonas sp. UPD001]|nr:glycine zipper 2TM domain-containing protein [Blastomonas sp. UPD001]